MVLGLVCTYFEFCSLIFGSKIAILVRPIKNFSKKMYAPEEKQFEYFTKVIPNVGGILILICIMILKIILIMILS